MTPDDAQAIAGIYAPMVLETAISFEWVSPTVDEFRTRIEKTSATYPWLVATDDVDTAAGFSYANTHHDAASYRWSVNTSVFIRHDMRGQGVGKALYGELHRQLVALGYYRAYAGIALPNEASIALHKAAGYRPLGVCEKVGFKLGAWRDVGWWQKQLQPHAVNPVAPKCVVG